MSSKIPLSIQWETTLLPRIPLLTPTLPFTQDVDVELYRRSWRRYSIPIPQPKFLLDPIVPLHKSRCHSAYLAQILIPFPFSIVFCWWIPVPVYKIPFSQQRNGQIPVPPFRILLSTQWATRHFQLNSNLSKKLRPFTPSPPSCWLPSRPLTRRCRCWISPKLKALEIWPNPAYNIIEVLWHRRHLKKFVVTRTISYTIYCLN